MTGGQDCADAAATPALLLWSRLVQGAAAVVIVLSLTLLLSPRLGETIFNLVYFHQLSMPVDVPSLAHGYIWFANGIIGAVMAGWMICIILLARGPFLEGRMHVWNSSVSPCSFRAGTSSTSPEFDLAGCTPPWGIHLQSGLLQPVFQPS